MAKPKTSKNATPVKAEKGVTQITVSGYKSISQEQSVEIRPLTILAGANSSGKSSIMQPLLLLKQTLEASFDPGPLLLNGPNVKFTSTDQLFSRFARNKYADIFQIGITIGAKDSITTCFSRKTGKKLDVDQTTYVSAKKRITLRADMTPDEILSSIPPDFRELRQNFEWVVGRNRCFLELQLKEKGEEKSTASRYPIAGAILFGEAAPRHLRQIIHLPGLRGNPERTYAVTAVGPLFPGTFEKYAASVIAQWQLENKKAKLEELGRDFNKLGLTWKVTARPINDTQVELQVGRLISPVKGGAMDLVNIADVGFGISQTLPVLVALLVAEPGQLVYLEQPEIHLHPRAQTAMAEILANAANRGVRVVAETHSSLLLLGIQTLVAEGKLSPEKVKLHWFRRRESGSTEIESANLDRAGAFGDWPEDFAEVALKAESRYLDAAESHQMTN